MLDTGIILSNNKYKQIEKSATKYNYYIVYAQNSFELLDLIIKRNPKFLLIDTKCYDDFMENFKKFLCNFTYMNNRIKFISKDNFLSSLEFLNTNNPDEFFYEISMYRDSFENNYLYLENLRISNFLKSLNLSTKHFGFHYIKDIIMLAIINQKNITTINSVYYYNVALKHQKTVTSVSRSVARIVENSYNNENKYLWSNLLEVKFIQNYKPTSKEFISLIIEKLLSNKI